MLSPATSIIRRATRPKDAPLNILTASTHEAYQTGLAETGHNFYLIHHESFKPWSKEYRKVPDNHHLVNHLPMWIDFDLVLSQNKFGQFQVLANFANMLQLPLVSLEHTLPMPQWSPAQRTELQKARGNINVFISNYSINQWGFDPSDPTVRVIEHMIDTDEFYPMDIQRENVCLSVVNDWIMRDWCCGFNLWAQAVKLQTPEQLPIKVLGSTKGLSEPAKNVQELVTAYQTSKVFINTSLISPIPTALMEAMACGCAVVTTGTCMIPEVVEHGVNGFIADNPDDIRKYVELLLSDDELATKLGNNARKTIEEKYNKERFVNDWNKVFYEAANDVVLYN